MKIGVLADSHDHQDNVVKAAELFRRQGVAALIHAGDICSQFTLRHLEPLGSSGVKMFAVFGNNDGDRLLLERKAGRFVSFRDTVMTLELGGRRIVVMHYPDVAESLLRSGDYDLVVYGHTHEAVLREEGRRLLLNPGSCAGYVSARATVAVVDLEAMKAQLLGL